MAIVFERTVMSAERDAFSPEELETGREWVALLGAKLEIEEKLKGITVGLDGVEGYPVLPGVEVVFSPKGVVRREVKSARPVQGSSQEKFFVFSDARMPVDSFGVYRDGDNYARAVLRGPIGADSTYQEVRPRLDRLSASDQVAVVQFHPVEQAA